jgi:hypothetical protein
VLPDRRELRKKKKYPLKIKTTKCQQTGIHVFHFLFALGKIIILAYLAIYDKTEVLINKLSK